MRSQLQFVITAGLLCHLFLGVTPVASQALPQSGMVQNPPEQSGPCHAVLTAPPAMHTSQPQAASQESSQKPGSKTSARPKLLISPNQPVDVTARECEQAGKVYTLRGDVEIKFGDYIFHGDTVTYDRASGDATVTGNAVLDGGPRDVHITASHATYNVRSQTGIFYDVAGTTGARFRGHNVTLTSSSPITFAGKVVEQTGPDEYVLHHGSVTSCELPHPKWRFHAAKIILRVGESAKVYNTTFRLKGVPVLYLPYAAPPVERLGRQSGFLIPTIGTSSAKGTIVGDSFYWAIDHSMDATLGAEYLSRRGWLLREDFRAKPSQNSYLNVNYFQVLDRGIVQNVQVGTLQNPRVVTTTVDQGGQDIKINGGAVFNHGVRGVASLEYLSSFVFRLAFTENFSQAVDSEVRSTAFLSKSWQGFSFNSFASRYQNFQSTDAGDVITILHTPGLESSSVDQRIFKSPFYWSYTAAAEGVRRSEPGFVTPGVVGRFDIDPALSLPLFFRGWIIRPEVALHDTVYTQQDIPGPAGPLPTNDSLNRRALESSLEFRPPALEKVFDRTWAGRKIKHTVEPRLIYRYTNGLENFASIIRFDFRDILSNTNEAEYGLIQRLYLKHVRDECNQETKGPPVAKTICSPAGADEFLTWEVKQKYFLDPNFGGALVNGRRNVLATTVDFAGIAFLTDPRRFSPIDSRLRLRTSGISDLEWQLDYDTKKGRINSSTVYTTLHFGDFFVGASHAYLQVPGEVVFSPGTTNQLPPCIPASRNPTACVPLEFNQVRGLLGYGSPSKRGWSAATNIGYDSEFKLLQYAAAQTAYNWDCCGLSFEYRHFSLGPVRRDNQYRFVFTLANIGSFGNLKRQERLF